MLVLIPRKYSKENDSYKKHHYVMIRDLGFSSQFLLLKVMYFMRMSVCMHICMFVHHTWAWTLGITLKTALDPIKLELPMVESFSRFQIFIQLKEHSKSII